MSEATPVLVVESDPAHRAILEEALRGAGAQVESCTSPVVALGRLARHNGAQVEALVVAADLPGMGMAMLVRAARSMPGRADLPLVVVGGDGASLPTGAVHAAHYQPACVSAAWYELTGRIAAGAAPPKVLVVDDYDINRLVLIKIIASCGVAVDSANDGLDALAKADRERYALILMDCEMPRMDGLEATRAIRRLEEGKGWHTPIIACTARALAEDRAAGLAAGMDDYLIKPITTVMIEAQLDRWIHHRAIAAPTAVPVTTTEAEASLPLVEMAVLQRIRGYGSDALERTVGQFLSEMDDRLDELRRLHAAADVEQLRQRAHAFKGTAGCLGAKRLWRQLSLLENAVRSGDLALVGDHLERAVEIAAGTVRAMRAFNSA